MMAAPGRANLSHYYRPPTPRKKCAARMDLLDACPPYLTREQASTVAGVTTRTVDRWLRDPEVPLNPYRSTGRRRPVLIDREEFRAMLTIQPEENSDG